MPKNLGKDSTCSIARALDVVGDAWTLLIVRDAMIKGSTRFQEFRDGLGIAPNILAKRLSALVDRIREQVPRLVPDVEVVGDPVRRLPHIVTFSCLYVEGEALLTELDRFGFAVSSGSSCTADTLRPSHVLEAMGVITHGNVRVSLPRGTKSPDVDRFLTVLADVVSRLRRDAGMVTG